MDSRFISALGVVCFIALAWGISFNRKLFPWRTVISGLILQIVFALLILKTSFGEQIFLGAQKLVDRLNICAGEGARMVFGPLANQNLLAEKWGPENAFIFAIVISATIIVISALSSLLYYWVILQQVVRAAAWVMQRDMKTRGSESLASAANIFMGQTEAPLVVKPYLLTMTASELMSLMTAGMATIAGGVAVAYVSMGVSAGHLLTASVMSAPAALMIAKIILPETAPSKTAKGCSAAVDRNATNAIDSLCRGASDGMAMSLNVFAMLIAFVAVVSLANFILGALQTKVFQIANPITLQVVFGWLNAPFAWLMGIPARDCMQVGQSLGERIVLNEFVGYLTLTNANKSGLLDPRSFTLATYALCGFANFASIAIQIGGIGALVPERRPDLARFGVRAMIGGILASYITANIAGVLI
jgi:concentrative nucleoside transporter, CNT family